MINENTDFYDDFWKRAKYEVEALGFYNKDESFIFGTKGAWDGHDCKILPTMSLSEITQIEKDKSITLPGSFRSFLLNYGAGGAGPNYGIVNIRKAFEGAVFDKPFVYYEYYAENGIEDFSGLLYIATAGCGTNYYIELKGKTVGTIWCNWGSTGSSNEGNLCNYYTEWFYDSYASIISRQNKLIQELQERTKINTSFYTVEKYDKALNVILGKSNGTPYQCSHCYYPVEYDRLTTLSLLLVFVLPIIAGVVGSNFFDSPWYYFTGGVAIIVIFVLALMKEEFTSKPSKCPACKTKLFKPLKKIALT